MSTLLSVQDVMEMRYVGRLAQSTPVGELSSTAAVGPKLKTPQIWTNTGHLDCCARNSSSRGIVFSQVGRRRLTCTRHIETRRVLQLHGYVLLYVRTGRRLRDDLP